MRRDLHCVKARDPLRQGGPTIRHQTVPAKHRGVQVAAASTKGVSGLARLQERGWHWSPRNEGEAASSQNLVGQYIILFLRYHEQSTYEGKGEHRDCKGVPSTKGEKTCLVQSTRGHAGICTPTTPVLPLRAPFTMWRRETD